MQSSAILPRCPHAKMPHGKSYADVLHVPSHVVSCWQSEAERSTQDRQAELENQVQTLTLTAGPGQAI